MFSTIDYTISNFTYQSFPTMKKVSKFNLSDFKTKLNGRVEKLQGRCHFLLCYLTYLALVGKHFCHSPPTQLTWWWSLPLCSPEYWPHPTYLHWNPSKWLPGQLTRQAALASTGALLMLAQHTQSTQNSCCWASQPADLGANPAHQHIHNNHTATIGGLM